VEIVKCEFAITGGTILNLWPSQESGACGDRRVKFHHGNTED